MSKLTPPSPKNIIKRRDFFLQHLDLSNARWEVFNLTNLIIVRDYENKKIDRGQFIALLHKLDKDQGLPQTESSMTIESVKENSIDKVQLSDFR